MDTPPTDEHLGAPALFEWQERFLEGYWRQVESGGVDFLLEATPGSGKTLAALYVARRHLERGSAGRALVVVPTEHLKEQWADVASRVGLQLDPKWTSDYAFEAAGFDGVVVTYAQLWSAMRMVRWTCERRPTFVVLDEIHHAGEGRERDWCDALRVALETTPYRLALSGTPFRSDGRRIPFVTYVDGKSLPEMRYGYAEALRDGVVGPVFFPSFEGDMSWWTQQYGHREAAFRDELPADEQRRRLRTALDPSSDWLRTVIAEAHTRLMEIRATERPDAGGLVLTIDQPHARAVAEVVAEVTGQVPAVAISDDPAASTTIEAFHGGRAPWLIAVRMVSEGVDIPRLRVGVFATNVLTEMYFRQAVGRFVRGGEAAHVYIPSDPVLVGFAQTIKEERDHELDAELKRARERLTNESGDEDDGPTRQIGMFIPIGATATLDDVIIDGLAYSQAELAHARALAIAAGGADYDPYVIARILRSVGHATAASAAEPRPIGHASQSQPLHKTVAGQRRLVSNLSRKLAYRAGLHFKDVGRLLMLATGEYMPPNPGLDCLTRRLELLEQWLGFAEKHDWSLSSWEEEANRAHRFARG